MNHTSTIIYTVIILASQFHFVIQVLPVATQLSRNYFLPSATSGKTPDYFGILL